MSFVRSGAVSGVIAALAFTAIHQWLISDIWSTVPVMLIFGGLCGLCVGWAFSVVFKQPTLVAWLGFNATFVVMFVAQAAVSIAVFEPITTFAAVVAANESPTELIVNALPVTLTFTVLYATLIAGALRRSRAGFGAALVTSAVLNLTLGINVTPLGLVEIPTSAFYLIAELFGLIVLMTVMYAAVFAVLERKKLTRPAV